MGVILPQPQPQPTLVFNGGMVNRGGRSIEVGAASGCRSIIQRSLCQR
jgi:hypothetical protein